MATGQRRAGQRKTWVYRQVGWSGEHAQRPELEQGRADDPVVPVQPIAHRVLRAGLRVGSGDLVVLGPAPVVGALDVVGPLGLRRVLARMGADGPADPAPVQVPHPSSTSSSAWSSSGSSGTAASWVSGLDSAYSRSNHVLGSTYRVPSVSVTVSGVHHEPVRSLTLSRRSDGGVLVDATAQGGQAEQWLLAEDEVFLNLGCRPSVLPGLCANSDDWYCSPDHQHPGVLTAGDLRSARAQRIMTATGSGSDAALRAYYATRLDDWTPEAWQVAEQTGAESSTPT